MKAKQVSNLATGLSAAGNLAGMAVGIPGLGNLITLPLQPVINQMQETEELKSQFSLKYSPKQFAYGGFLTGSDTLIKYKGKTHKEGGIGITSNGLLGNEKEVEDGEVLYHNKKTGKK
jgi:hypothetical protein